MRNKLFQILSILLFLATTLSNAQTKLIEEVTKKGDEVVIPFEKYELENGLTLIIHEDHSDPLVHVDVTYHVGSAREELNKSGFAHFFEHMMFQGSDNVADEEHFKIISESGGTLNGTTNRDRTNYFETAPSNQLETMLWLESDRMGFFLDAVTQEKFEVQRATVKNEKQQNYDNRPYGRYSETSARALYPYGHPYSWLTIGILEDLDRVDVDDLKKFFMRWYGPNNATLTIGGDVNPADVVKLVEKYFGEIPRGPEVENMSLETPVLEEDRYVSYVDNNIRFPALIITYPTVPRFHSDEAPLDCLSGILGSGQGSYFYKKFVKTQQAIQASSFSPATELAGEFSMFVLPYPGKSLSEFETEIRAILDEFETEGVKDEDLEKFKAGYESGVINGLATVSGKVSQLASFETFRGNPNYIKDDLARYQNVTKEDVMRVFNKYIKGKHAVYCSVIANEEQEPAKPDNFTPQKEGENPFPTTDYTGLTYKKTKSGFDRSARPVPGKSPLVSVPEFWEETTANGIKVIGTKSDEIPTVAIQLNINGGHKLDAYDPSKSGLAVLTASLLGESTAKRSAEEMSVALEKLGSRINFYAGNTNTTVSVRTLKKNLKETVALMEEALMSPGFVEEDFEKVKKQQLEGIKASQKEPAQIANNVYTRLLYGDDHIFSVPAIGIEESVEKITLDDVKAFYNNYYSPNISELVIVGDVSEEEIKSVMSFLNSWEKKSVKISETTDVSSINETKIFLVDKVEAPQSEIRIGYMTDLPYDATGEFFKTYLMNYPLGGAFNSRINLNLREDKGWTYGARSYFRGGDEPGPFTASAGIKAAATDSAVVEFMTEITEYSKNGITEDELNFMKKSIGQRDARSYEAPYQKASFLRRIVHYDLDKDYVKEQNKIIDNITKEEIDALAKKQLPYQKMNILVVGDKASLKEKLAELNYDIIELDEKGEVVKDDTVIEKENK
ncbi:MAG: insulinase family protein [Flammeovirgaceae bacterium]|nr:insulinase family protein [Flammeovirgaceae bacterium]